MKKWIVGLLLGVMVFSLGACGTSGQDKKAEKPSNKELRVGILTIDDSLPIAIADQEKAYEKAGLNVKLYPFKSSSDQSKAMESGELDIVMNDMIVQGLMRKGGTNTKIISYAFGATPQEGRFMVLASPQSGINSVKELEGKKIAISNNTMMEYLINRYSGYYHLDTSQTEYINMPNLMLRLEALLAGNDIQAAILPDPLASFAVQKGCIPIIDDTTLDANYSQSVLLATDSVIKEREGDIQVFLDVTFDKMKAINEKPNDYRAAALSFAKVPETLHDEYLMPRYTPAALPSEEQVQDVMTWLQEKGLIDAPYAYSDMVESRFVNAK